MFDNTPAEFPYLERLNEQQRAAVVNTEGPSLIVAGAGSGKTTVLTTRIAYLVEQGVDPWNVLALTFTNKAAREMRDRVEKIVGPMKAKSLWMGTFHSIFSRILRKEAFVFGFDSNYTIYQPSDTKSLLKAIVKEKELDDKTYKISLLANRISEAKNMLVTPKRYHQNNDALMRDRMDNVPLFEEIYQEYFKRCHSANAMDFDDLLLYTFILFDVYPEVRERYAEKFKYVLVDEFQDTNYAQFCILNQLAGKHQNICVVGDDAQSIYSFRGARVDNILTFDRVFPDTSVFKLERNYRSTQNIVNAANSLIHKNKYQIDKRIYSENEEGSPLFLNELTSDTEEGEMVCNRIAKLRREGVGYSNMAVLYRTNGQSRILEEAMRKHRIPYIIYGSNSFYDRKETKDVMAYLRLIINPNDEEALRRIINYPTRGIGDTTLAKVFACAQEQNTTPWNVVQQPELYNLNVNKGTVTKLMAFAAMIKDLAEAANGLDAYMLGDRVLKDSGLMALAQADRTSDGKEVMDNYSSLLNGMSQFVDRQKEMGEPFAVGINDYLSEVSLLTDSDMQDESGEAVRMMTIHIAKGLEFDVVFITGLEQDLFPSMQVTTTKEYEEERRLFFVAITRAKKRCYLSNAKTRFRFGKSDCYEPSDFLKDIDQKYIYQESSSRSIGRGNFSDYIDFEESDYRPRSVGRPDYGRGSYNGYSKPNSRRGGNDYAESVSRRPNMKRIGVQGASQPTQSTSIGTSQVKEGTKVEHATFGLGTVLRLENNATGLKAVIQFVNCGEKTLLLKFAKLKVIG